MTNPDSVKPVLHVAVATALLLLVPLIAMQFTTEVAWGPGDFLVAAALLFTAGMAYSISARKIRTSMQRAVVGLVVFTALAAIWAELAVGLFS